MIVLYWLLSIIIAVAMGLYVGGAVNAYRWARNAHRKGSIVMRYRGTDYKVTIPDDEDF